MQNHEMQTRLFNFQETQLRAVFNPARITSSAASTDEKSIKERACFLCKSNRPTEQKSIKVLTDYELLINPFPVFPEHLTIPTIEHTKQLLSPQRIKDMLTLAKFMPAYTLLYNGAKCGASAPDHFHFQAGTRLFMPVEKEIIEKGITLFNDNTTKITTVTNFLRKIIMIRSTDSIQIMKRILQVIDLLGNIQKCGDEPMMNIITFFENNAWHFCIFPRSAHRPKQFFEEGERRILFSPGTVDMGGVLIFPLKKDFDAISSDEIADIFAQVTLSDSDFETVSQQIQQLQ
ncbi:MAG: DUF4922 domain-containing protein [Culturomica sp.]|jgi:ATP adenylyltransferase/5',5'''-P-1,P-4-tetraphosphate phosphorylase II|nr:DUF4922 domain-containing protein [Culturomica sp.]